jgi:hypothetical protein
MCAQRRRGGLDPAPRLAAQEAGVLDWRQRTSRASLRHPAAEARIAPRGRWRAGWDQQRGPSLHLLCNVSPIAPSADHRRAGRIARASAIPASRPAGGVHHPRIVEGAPARRGSLGGCRRRRSAGSHAARASMPIAFSIFGRSTR